MSERESLDGPNDDGMRDVLMALIGTCQPIAEMSGAEWCALIGRHRLVDERVHGDWRWRQILSMGNE